MQLGFDYCGVAKAKYLYEDAKRLEIWLKEKRHGEMNYMENHFDMRVDPTKLFPDAKTVVTLLHNYYTDKKQENSNYLISKYAYGNDYHKVIKKKLKALLLAMQNEWGNIQGRGFVDSAPILERAWAIQSGLGWVGKNGNLITKKSGSYFFIATLIIDIELPYDYPFQTDHCGTCTRCIDVCPTQAILDNKKIDAQKCISYYTIELKDNIVQSDTKWNNWIFGCDICQEVCPWNRFAQNHDEEAFNINNAIKNFSDKDWEEITEEIFQKNFSQSPLKRTKWKGIKRNLRFVKN